MKLRDLSIAAIVLAVVLGVLYWSNHREQQEDPSVRASLDAQIRILSLSQTEITRLAIHRKGQPQVELSRNGSGTWQITAPELLPADQEDVSSVLSTLSSLNSDRLLEEKALDLTTYGLGNPALELDVTLKDNKTEKLLIGDSTPSGNAYYVMLAGNPRLFTVASYNKSTLDKGVNDLRDKHLLTVDFDKVTQIEFLNQQPVKKQNITFARDKNAWQILRPKPFRADTDQVEELIRSLRAAKMDVTATADDAKTAAAFKSASPFATARVTGTSGTQELEVRKGKDDYFAKSSAVSGVYKVLGSVGTGLDKGLDDFRNKKVFDLGYQDPNKIEIHDGPKSYFFTHSGSDWWGPAGEKLDETSSRALVNKLRELSAAKFPDSGFSAPTLEITITSNDSKRIERVSIARNGDAYIAKRENEPSLYELPSSAVLQLEESAANVKPSSAPKK